MRSKSHGKIQDALVRAQRFINVLSSPAGLALAFGFGATTSSIIAAYWEGRLVSPEYIGSAGGNALTVLPFDRNFSTLLDFAFLNPVVLYFLQRARAQERAVARYLKMGNAISPYHRIGLATLSIALGIYAMKFYVQGSRFYDATMLPSANGQVTITVTGWIVYSWTALYLAGLFYAVIEHGTYVAYIMRLEQEVIPYEPFHPDQAGGIRFVMNPSLSFGYAMIGLLLTFVVFIIQDKILYHIESNRLLGFVAYIVVAAPFFGIPFCRLHALMKSRRNDYLFDALNYAMPFRINIQDLRDTAMLKERVATIEYVDRYQKIVRSFPVWPIPISLTLGPFGSIFAATLPLIGKLLSVALPGLLVAGQ